MGFINNMHRGQKDVDKLLRQDFENRASAFDKEYRDLVHKYRCTHKAILDFVSEGSGGIIPKMVIIDATELLDKRDKLDKVKLKEKDEQEKK